MSSCSTCQPPRKKAVIPVGVAVPALRAGTGGSPAATKNVEDRIINSAANAKITAWARSSGKASIVSPTKPATAKAINPPPKKRQASIRLRASERIERPTMSLYGTATTPLTKA